MKTILLMAVVMLGLLQSARAYSLGGPIANGPDSYQVQALSYNEPGDLNAPKNLGQEYRRNTPVMFYTYDKNFVDYFGSSGMTPVDAAFTVLNVTFTNSPQGPVRGLDGYSADLNEFPLESRHINYQAQALGILDMQSVTLTLMMEQLGLADPVRYTWTLHDRYLVPGGTCPADEEYLVVQRNFDYVSSPLNQPQYSAYVNDVLYTYQIEEFCTGTPWLAVAAPYSVDPEAVSYSPVAGAVNSAAISWGDYFKGLTRDDVAGLRYLLQTNNINHETVPADGLLDLITTNLLAPGVYPPYIFPGSTNLIGLTNGGYYIFNGSTNGGLTNGVFGYGDYGAFLAFTATNNPAAVQAAYPGVVISSFTVTPTNTFYASIFAYYTNAPYGSPVGTPPRLVVVTNYYPIFEFLYNYTFANVFPNHVTTGIETLIDVTVAAPYGSPLGSPGKTNTVVTYIKTISGDFFVLPFFYTYTNVCPLDLITTNPIITVLATTNLLGIAATNTLTTVLTNTTATNLTSYTYLITYFTNYSYVAYPVTCTEIAGATGDYQGIEKIQFVKVPTDNYDTGLGQFRSPVTNDYTLTLYTNGQLQVQYIHRVLTVPDILFSTADLVGGGANNVPSNPWSDRNLNFDTANVLPRLAGPGTITSPTTITWNNAGPIFFNTPSGTMFGTPYFTATPESDVTNLFYEAYHILGAFDGTTNAPVVFANGASIDNLENQMLIKASPQTVTNGVLNQPYGPVQFTASGGQLTGSYSWTATGLPDGMSVSADGQLSGTPTETGTFNFTMTVTDSNGLSVQWVYTFLIQ